MANESVVSNRAEEPTNFSLGASEQSGLSLKEADVRQQEYERVQSEEQEEEIQLKARLARLELETSGKQYFKPQYDNHYFLTFDRMKAVSVRGVPSEKLTRKVQDRQDKNITHEVPTTEWIHEVTHENGDVQSWSITSKTLQEMIVKRMGEEKFSTIEFWKEKTGKLPTDVKYNVIGVR